MATFQTDQTKSPFFSKKTSALINTIKERYDSPITDNLLPGYSEQVFESFRISPSGLFCIFAPDKKLFTFVP